MSTPVHVPAITFLYTLDQIAGMVQISRVDLMHKYLYYHLRSTGRKGRHQMLAVNIAPDEKRPEWRITHQDFVRWLRAQGFSVKPMADL